MKFMRPAVGTKPYDYNVEMLSETIYVYVQLSTLPVKRNIYKPYIKSISVIVNSVLNEHTNEPRSYQHKHNFPLGLVSVN